MNFYTSDLHFGHKNVIGFDHRPFSCVEEMDAALVRLWNERVDKEDDVYILGDFTMHSGNSPVWYLRQLRGRKHLVTGNHDGIILQDEHALSYFNSVDKMCHVEDVYKGTSVQACLCHFPIVSWNGKSRGSWHIFGHIHNNADDEAAEIMARFDHALNAGCMVNNYSPASFSELVRNNEAYRKKLAAEKERVRR